jgi:hypothetical protein
MLGNSWVAELLVASQEGLGSMELLAVMYDNISGDKIMTGNIIAK